VKKGLANSEPSTHGTKRTHRDRFPIVRFRGKADMDHRLVSTYTVAIEPKRT